MSILYEARINGWQTNISINISMLLADMCRTELPHFFIYIYIPINEWSRVKSKLNLKLYLQHFRKLPGGGYCVKRVKPWLADNRQHYVRSASITPQTKPYPDAGVSSAPSLTDGTVLEFPNVKCHLLGEDIF